MNLLHRNIAITDVETSGLDASVHEILEIAVLVVRPSTFDVLWEFSTKVKPEHPEVVTPEALAVNGYNEVDWENATDLYYAMVHYGQMTRDAIFCAHNITFDWAFVSAAFKKTGLVSQMDYHRIDLFSLAWMKLRSEGVEKFNLNELAKHFGIPEEPSPHTAHGGVTTAFNVLRALLVR